MTRCEGCSEMVPFGTATRVKVERRPAPRSLVLVAYFCHAAGCQAKAQELADG